MLRLLGTNTPHCDGVTRRELLRVGGIGLGGLSLAGLLRAGAAGRPRAKAKSAIVLFLGGGAPQHETWDPKPDAPADVRGAFGTVATRTPGLRAGELMPLTAALTDKIAVVRSVVTGDNAHSTSGYQMHTGVPHVPVGKENATPGRPNDWPSLGALVRYLRPPAGGLPSSVALPRRLANFNGLYPWPGTDAGFLGRRFDPWLLHCDPTDPDFAAPGCEPSDDLPPLRLDGRRSLLGQVDRHLGGLAAVADHDRHKRQALDLIAGRQGRAAFDLAREPDRVRDRYGRTKFGQSCLLARRLVEAGVSLVQVNWASDDLKRPNSGGWDTHERHNESLKGWLMPAMDRAYSALLDDLDQRGLLGETLVCWVAEFGHTPRFNARAGRDHWGRAFSIALAGGGVKGGVVYGKTDRLAAEVAADPVRPPDDLATVFHCLGYGPDTEYRDVEGRPLPITRGQPIDAVLR